MASGDVAVVSSTPQQSVSMTVMTFTRHRMSLFAAAALLSLAFGGAAFAVGTDQPAAPTGDKKTEETKPDDKKPTDAKTEDKKPEETKAPDKKSQNEFLDGYRNAYNLIYKQHDYAAGIAALKALGHDEHPDVANLIGFSSRKLGRTDDAKVWYEKALAADHKHTRTWQYFGMWHLEQGNRLKAEEHLEKIQVICGTGCEDYLSLRKALDGNMTY